MKNLKTTKSRLAGFALLYALWFSAIASVLGLSMVGSFLTNTASITSEAHRIQGEFLHQAALRYAVLDIIQPRETVAKGGVPISQLIYTNPLTPVNVSVENEAAFVDLLLTPPSVLMDIFEQLNLDTSIVEKIEIQKKELAKNQAPPSSPINVRWLKRALINNDDMFKRVTAIASFYNGASQVNQNTVSESLLRALPDLSGLDASRLIANRDKQSKQLVSDAISHPMLSNRASGHYRISTTLTLGGVSSSRTHIIRISKDAARLYEVVARL